MEKITSSAELKQAIILLEIKHRKEGALLKEELKITLDSLHPLSLLKNKFTELATESDSKSKLLNSVISLATGYLSKKLVIGETHNPLKQLLGVVFQMVVTGVVSKNSAEIKSEVLQIIDNLFTRKAA